MQTAEALAVLSWLRINWTRKHRQNTKRTAPCRLDPKFSPLRKSKCPSTRKNFWQYKGNFPSLHMFGGKKTKPSIVLTDSKSVTRFFQTKANPPALLNAYGSVLQFIFKKTYIAGSINTAANFLSRLDFNVVGKIRLKIQEHIQTTFLRWHDLLRTSLMKSNFSSLKQTRGTI